MELFVSLCQHLRLESALFFVTGTRSLVFRIADVEVVAESDAHTLLIGVVILSSLANGIVSDVLGR